MQMLSRLYAPQSGRIMVDNYDIAKVELYSLRRQIGIVPQEPLLFTGTVAAAPDAEQRAAIRRVQTGLAELAYTPGEINGELTRETRDAIMAFQRDHKMPETGEVSDELIAELGKVSGQSETATQ